MWLFEVPEWEEAAPISGNDLTAAVHNHLGRQTNPRIQLFWEVEISLLSLPKNYHLSSTRYEYIKIRSWAFIKSKQDELAIYVTAELILVNLLKSCYD